MFDYQNKIQYFVPRYPRLTFSLITYTYLKKKSGFKRLLFKSLKNFKDFIYS